MDSSLRFACVAICVAFFERGTHAQDPDDARLRRERIVEDLARVYRYDSDLSVESGWWLSRFVHLRLGGSGKAREAIFLSFNPRLLSQVAEAARPSSRESTAIEFQEYRFPIETCEGLSAEIAELQAALGVSVNSIGQRSSELNSQEIIVDGRHYGLNVRANGYTVGQFRVGENERRLFEPLDAIVHTVEMCSKSASAQRRAYDF
jgi:hypothetical protein